MFTSTDQPSDAGLSQILITVHGIRTFGQWQERLKAILGEQPSLRAFHYKFGYFSIFSFLVPPLRWLVVRRFQAALEAKLDLFPRVDVDMVGHSFGTHLIGWSLLGISRRREIKIRHVILAGSVLRSTFPWDELLKNGSIRSLTNECGSKDSILLLSQLFVLFTGMAGRLGFIGMTSLEFVNNFHPFGHSGFFEKDGKPSDDFMRNHWRPILIDSRLPIAESRPSGPLAGFTAFFLQNAEPIKITLYLIVFAIPLAYVYGLYQTQRVETLKAESSQLSYKSSEEIWKDPIQSGRDAARAYQTSKTAEAATALSTALAQANVIAVLYDPAQPNAVSAAAFSRDERTALLSKYLGGIYFWDIATARQFRKLAADSSFHISTDSESPDGQLLAVGGQNSELIFYDMQSGRVKGSFKASSIGSVTSTSFSPDGRFLATSSDDNTVTIWDVPAILTARPDPQWSLLPAKLVSIRNFKANIVNSVHFSDDGKFVLSAHQRGIAVVWEWRSNRFQVLDRYAGTLRSAEFAPHDHTRVVTACQDGNVTLYALSNPGNGSVWPDARQLWSLPLHDLDVSQASFSPAGDAIVTASHDGGAAIWSAKDGGLLYHLPGHRGAVTSASFNRDSTLILTSSTDGSVRVWSAQRDKVFPDPDAAARFLGAR